MVRVASVAFTQYDSDPRVRRMAESLAERGDDVTVIALREPRESRTRELNGVRIVGIGIPQYRGNSIFAYLAQYLGFLLVSTVRLTLLHLRRRFAVIHINNMPDFMVFAALPSKLLGAKVILDIHDPMPELYASKFSAGSSHPAVRLVATIERASVAFADRAISVHDVQLETLVSHGNPRKKFTVIQNSPDERYFPRGLALEQPTDRNSNTIVYHGTMAPRLGLEAAVRAVNDIRERIDSVTLLLIGDGDDVPKLRSLIDELDLWESVDLRQGFVPVDALLPQLLTADIGVVPAQVDPFTRNMLPTKLLEYVALGIPCIATDLPTVRRYFEDDEVLIIPPDDPVALGQAMLELLLDPQARRNRARKALRFIDEHGWPIQRERYFALIDNLSS